MQKIKSEYIITYNNIIFLMFYWKLKVWQEIRDTLTVLENVYIVTYPSKLKISPSKMISA